MARRRIWLLATAVAFLTLQTPLCALACLERSETTAPPCHADDSEPSPQGAPDSHDDCGGCQLSSQSLLPGPDLHPETSPPSLPAARPRWAGLAPGPAQLPAIPVATDLPPPDVLLRKATLLL